MHNLHGPNCLFSTQCGHIRLCEPGSRVQIQFRDHTLRLDEEELEVLVDTVHHAWRRVADAEGQDEWTLQAGHKGGTMDIVLDEAALHALNTLLQGAWSMYVLRERVSAVASGAEGFAHDVLRDHVPEGDFPH
ncbi:MAG: hypothetical protein BRD55_01945 [Bacteroidetes bacterium SW_9_63_38]|nr:MAG: hypothetical protein BRD55_01945 [Bacteroidetes bacterium SW_9_63_38]